MSQPNDAGWFQDAPSVVPDATDLASGVVSLRCAVDPATEIGGHDDLSQCEDNYEFTENGAHRVYAVARDLAGNTSATRFLEVRVDGEAPSLEATVHPTTVVRGNPIAVSWTGSDRHSGIEDVTCAQPDTSQVGAGFASCVAYDRAGNTSQALAAFTVTPADVSVDLTTAKAAGTRIAVTALLEADGIVDGATVEVVTPSSLRVDGVPTGCVETALGMTCEKGSFIGKSSLTMTVTPTSPGPHVVDVSISAPDDPDPANDSDDAGIGPAKVCDNVPTSGADAVTGTPLPDILCGLGGNDVFRGMAGNDLIFGGTGADTVSYAGAPATAVDLRKQGLGLIGAQGRFVTGHGKDSFTSIENVLGGSGADLLTGNNLVNWLRGGLGADVLLGLGGRDRLDGGAGNDRLTGGSSVDTLIGGTGTDTCREATDNRTGCERS